MLLAELAFVDPQRTPGWAHATVPAGGGPALAPSPRPYARDELGADLPDGLTAWLEDTWSTSLLVVTDGAVVHEWYADGLGPATLFLGASMTKSALSQLVHRRLGSGITLDDRVVDHVPELRGTGYDGPSVRDVLTMTSGVDWVEDHRDPQGAATRLLACFADGGDSRGLLREVRPGVAPGTRWSYCTADSQVLDWVRESATGLSFADDLADLWRDLGCTADAVVGVDGQGVAMAGGGLAATARDWARVAHDVPASAARPAHPFTRVGHLPDPLTRWAGFGHHWWPMDDDGHRVTADGSRGQFACTDRRTGAVVVKTSRWPFADPVVDSRARDLSYQGLHAILDVVGGEAGVPAPPHQEDLP